MENTMVFDGAKLLYDPCPGDSWASAKRIAVPEVDEVYRGVPVGRGCWKLILNDDKFIVVHGGPVDGVIKFRQASFVTTGRVENRPDVAELLDRPAAADLFDVFLQREDDKQASLVGLNAARDRQLLWIADNLWSSKISLRVPNFFKLFMGSDRIGRSEGDTEKWNRLRKKAAGGIQEEGARKGILINREDAWAASDDPAFRSRDNFVTIMVETRKPALHLLPTLEVHEENGVFTSSCFLDEGDGAELRFRFDSNSRYGKKISNFFKK